jgi:hypothetical protein
MGRNDPNAVLLRRGLRHVPSEAIKGRAAGLGIIAETRSNAAAISWCSTAQPDVDQRNLPKQV